MINDMYEDDSITFHFGDVQHVEHNFEGGIVIVFKSTRWNFEKDAWENSGWVSQENQKRFFSEWRNYKLPKP